MNIGQIIKAKRQALAWSQRDLQRRIGDKLTQAKIAKLENGDQPNVTIETLRALAEGFGCSVIDLLPDEDKHPASIDTGGKPEINRIRKERKPSKAER